MQRWKTHPLVHTLVMVVAVVVFALLALVLLVATRVVGLAQLIRHGYARLRPITPEDREERRREREKRRRLRASYTRRT